VLLQRQSAADVLETVPLFVVISGDSVPINRADLIPELTPDCLIESGEAAVKKDIVGVSALRCGNRTGFLEEGAGGLLSFMASGDVEVYDSENGWSVLKPDVRLTDESQYSNLVALQALEHTMQTYPYREDEFRDRVLRMSRKGGVLSHHTAYIVVENSAQWEMLKRKEKDAMKSDSALEFDEFKEVHVTPEPPTWILFCLGLPLLLLHRLRIRRGY